MNNKYLITFLPKTNVKTVVRQIVQMAADKGEARQKAIQRMNKLLLKERTTTSNLTVDDFNVRVESYRRK